MGRLQGKLRLYWLCTWQSLMSPRVADEAQIIQRVSSGLETLASENSTIPDLKHLVQVTSAGLVDGWLRLRMSRMLWDCLPAYRGWAEVNGMNGETVGEEGGRDVF